jgi:hypothetical protein
MAGQNDKVFPGHGRYVGVLWATRQPFQCSGENRPGLVRFSTIHKPQFTKFRQMLNRSVGVAALVSAGESEDVEQSSIAQGWVKRW